MNATKLDNGQKHLMRLILKDKKGDGWTKVSSTVWPLMQRLPKQLVELKPEADGGYARLTNDGEAVIMWA